MTLNIWPFDVKLTFHRLCSEDQFDRTVIISLAYLWYVLNSHPEWITLKSVYDLDLDGWLVVWGLMALWDSISVYIEPSPREREKEKRKNRREKKCPNPHPHLLQAHTCDTSRIIWEASGNGADLPGSRKGRKTSRKLNIPITIFFHCPLFACIYGTDLKQQTVKGLT